jgi:hypothetical protein
MKIISVLSLLLSLALTSLAQPDANSYYAAPRLNYYTNEEFGEIMVYIPEKLKDHETTIDLVFEYQILNRGCKVASSGVSTVPFSKELLREGQNEITVSFNLDEKWVDSRKVYVTVLPHHDNEVKIEKVHGGLVTNGLVNIPVGFFTYFPVDPAFAGAEAVNGFDMISPYQKIDKKSLKERKSYMNRCADLGMRVNYNVCSVAGGGSDCTKLEGMTKAQKRDILKREVELFRDHPALLAWFIAENPDGRELPADSLVDTYRLIKELDPYHPVTLLVGSPRNAERYKNVTDIIMTAPSPIPQGTMLEVKDYTANPEKVLWPDKPVWSVPQAFGGNESWQREPNAAEVRAMTYMAIVSGASGFQYYIRSAPNSFPKSQATWSECATLAREIAELTPDLVSSEQAPEFENDNSSIHVKAFNREGVYTVVVVNDKPNTCPFVLKMKEGGLTIKSEVLFENRNIVVVNGVIEDFIDAYGTRVYRIDTRLKPDQEKELKAANLVIDPGFEQLTDVGVPAACYAYNGYDPGSTFFIDSRRHFEGEHSLRLNNPSEKPGNRLSFYGLDLDKRKSYTVSIMAMSGPSSNKAGGKKGGPVQFSLSLGSDKQDFDCSGDWQIYQICGVTSAVQGDENGRTCPGLELINKGTAWFDQLQVYPDMELKESPGSAENKRLIELKCVHADARIFYTTDGSEPTTLSTPYQVPLEIENAALLKAAAYTGERKVGYIQRYD